MLKNYPYEGFNTYSKRREKIVANILVRTIQKGVFNENDVRDELSKERIWGHDIVGRMYCEYLRVKRGEKSEILEQALNYNC